MLNGVKHLVASMPRLFCQARFFEGGLRMTRFFRRPKWRYEMVRLGSAWRIVAAVVNAYREFKISPGG